MLVHGAFQDERAWSEIKPRLEAAGHHVVTVQLAGRGSQPGPVEQISLNTYRDRCAVVRAQPGPVVLVGHSFGSITISAVAEAVPEKVRTLVYVAAHPGGRTSDFQSMAKLAESDKWNAFQQAAAKLHPWPRDYKTAGVLEDDIVMLFCGDCSPADQQRTKPEFFQREPWPPPPRRCSSQPPALARWTRCTSAPRWTVPSARGCRIDAGPHPRCAKVVPLQTGALAVPEPTRSAGQRAAGAVSPRKPTVPQRQRHGGHHTPVRRL